MLTEIAAAAEFGPLPVELVGGPLDGDRLYVDGRRPPLYLKFLQRHSPIDCIEFGIGKADAPGPEDRPRELVY